MEPFIRTDQYQFIKAQTQILINAHSSVNDKSVLSALRSLVNDKVLNIFFNLNDDQKQLINPMIELKERLKAEEFLEQIKEYVIPFQKVTEQAIQKLFPKAKRLKLPNLEEMDFKEITYLGWFDKGTSKKYIIVLINHELIGLHGTFTPSSKKGICSLCGHHAEIGFFMAEPKIRAQGTFIKRGNYICQDSQKCNENLLSVERLEEFFIHLKGKG